MDWKEATGDDALLVLSANGKRRVSGDLKSESKMTENIGIDVCKLLNYESVCIDSSYSTGKPVKVEFDR